MKVATSLDDIILHNEKLKKRGETLFNVTKFLDACPFCDEYVVSSIKASM